MGIGRGKNRRRADAAERAHAVKSLASRLATAAFRVCAVAALCAALYFGGTHGYQWATTSPTFGLKSITVAGTSRTDKVELCRLAGLLPGQNLFRMDVGAMTRAMEQHPWVRKVTVTRHFPSAVSVEVEEHKAAALAVLGELYLLDSEGEPFKKLERGDAVDLPLVTGINREKYVEKPEDAAARFRKALELAALFRTVKGKGETLSEVRIEGTDFTVVTQGGTEIRLGDEGWEEKLARLQKVRTELDRRGVSAEVIHLDNRARPGWVAVKVTAQAPERRRESVQ